jgi:hypothetical protein
MFSETESDSFAGKNVGDSSTGFGPLDRTVNIPAPKNYDCSLYLLNTANVKCACPFGSCEGVCGEKKYSSTHY